MNLLNFSDEIMEVLYEIPQGCEYATDSRELELEDIPLIRIEKMLSFLSSDNLLLVFESANILTAWLNDAGFNKLKEMLFSDLFYSDTWKSFYHAQDMKEQILFSFGEYLSKMDNQGKLEFARAKVYVLIRKILNDAGREIFGLGDFLFYVKALQLNEYKVPLQKYLIDLLSQENPQMLKLNEIVTFFRKNDQTFLSETLAAFQKSLDDFEEY
ncbi:TPA: hypothetical protein ACGO7A_001190 [Streptococcus suis]